MASRRNKGFSRGKLSIPFQDMATRQADVLSERNTRGLFIPAGTNKSDTVHPYGATDEDKKYHVLQSSTRWG